MYKIASIVIICSILVSCTHGDKVKNTVIASSDTASSQIQDVVQLSVMQVKNANIAVGKPESKQVNRIIKVSGTLEVPPESMVSVSTPLGGYVKKMALVPGQKVYKGEYLATVEDPQFIQLQQDYLTAKSKLGYLEAEFLRQQKLNETKAVSDKVYQQSKSEFESEKILLKSLSEKLRLLGINPDALTENSISRSIVIVSPIAGYVAKVNINPGKYVGPTDVLFELVNAKDLHLALTVFEDDAATLTVGQKLKCYTNINPEKKYDASILIINHSIGKDRATEVHCHIINYGKELMPGMYMNAAIELNNKAVNALPEEAVVKWNGSLYVFIEIAPNKYRMLPVETGASDNGYIEIKTKLVDDKVVVKGAYTLLMKMKNNGEE